MANDEQIVYDSNGIPMDFPDDFDRSNWPSELPLEPDYELTCRVLWRKDRIALNAYKNALDELIDFLGGEHVIGQTQKYRRIVTHPLLAQHYGFQFPRLAWADRKRQTRVGELAKIKAMYGKEEEEEEEHGPECPVDLRRMLAESARNVDVQPSLYESAVWASEHTTVVLNLGWDAVNPDDCIGLTALGLLQEAVNNPQKFYKEVLLPCVSKSQKQEVESFTDDGSEQIDYVSSLRRHMEAKG